MRPAFPFIFSLSALVVLSAGAAPRRPRVDESAMREALEATGPVGGFASAGAYHHFLRSRLFHNAGNHKQAADELVLALATEPGNVYLETSLAEEYIRLTDYDRAERLLKFTLDARPNSYPAHLLMGRALLETKKLDRARVSLRRAVKLRPKEADPYLYLAELGLEAGQLDEAMGAVNELADASGEATGLKRLGAALAERGKLPQAKGLLIRASKMDPGDFETWATLAQVDELLNEPELAEKDYDQALERDPDNRDVLLNAGRVALRLSAPSRARAYFDRLLSLSDDPELPVKVAFSYLASQRLEAAAEVLDDARRQGNHEPRLAFYAGLVHERSGDFSRAADAFGEIPDDSDLQKEARVHRGNCLAKGGRAKEAIGLLTHALAQTPEDVTLYPALAQAFELSGNASEAERFLQVSLNRRPASELYEALADLYGRRGRMQDAISLLQQGLQKRPDDELLRFSLATAYERTGDFEHSLSTMRAVLTKNPENAAAMNFIGYTLAEKGERLEEAEQLLTHALKLKPDNGSFLDSLGWIYFRRGDYSRAVATLEKAVGVAPDEVLILEHLGDAYRGAARAGEAAHIYQRALGLLRNAADVEARNQRQSLERKLKLLGAEEKGR